MTTATPKPPTIAENILHFITEQDDETQVVNLLGLLETDLEQIPIEQLVKDVAITLNEDNQNWLAFNQWEDAWKKVYSLIMRDPTRIPIEEVHRALSDAIDIADEIAEDSESDESDACNAITWLTQLALLIPAERGVFPEKALTRLKLHPFWQARQCAVSVLSDRGRGEECSKFLDDDDYDVASDAIDALPRNGATREQLAVLLKSHDLHKQVREAAQAVYDSIA